MTARALPWHLISISFERNRLAAFATSLRRCYLFSELPAQDLQCIASFVVQKRLVKGECLFREGAPFEGFYVVDEGAISVHRVNASGKMQVIHVFRAGESFAEAALAENTAILRTLLPSNKRACSLFRRRRSWNCYRSTPNSPCGCLGR